MNKVASMLERQAAWQRSRVGLTWTEKLRMAKQLRDAALAMKNIPPANHGQDLSAAPFVTIDIEGHRSIIYPC